METMSNQIQVLAARRRWLDWKNALAAWGSLMERIATLSLSTSRGVFLEKKASSVILFHYFYTSRKWTNLLSFLSSAFTAGALWLCHVPQCVFCWFDFEKLCPIKLILKIITWVIKIVDFAFRHISCLRQRSVVLAHLLIIIVAFCNGYRGSFFLKQNSFVLILH